LSIIKINKNKNGHVLTNTRFHTWFFHLFNNSKLSSYPSLSVSIRRCKYPMHIEKASRQGSGTAFLNTHRCSILNPCDMRCGSYILPAALALKRYRIVAGSSISMGWILKIACYSVLSEIPFMAYNVFPK